MKKASDSYPGFSRLYNQKTSPEVFKKKLTIP